MESSQLIDTISKERSDLRLEIVSYTQSIQKSLFVFITLLMAFLGIYLKEEMLSNSQAQAELS